MTTTNLKLSNAELAERLWRLGFVLCRPFKEALYCFKYNRKAVIFCFIWAILMTGLLIYKIDYVILSHYHLGFLRPIHSKFRFPYYLFVVFSGFYAYGFGRTALTQRVLNHLSDVFLAAGLKNNLGRLPAFVSDEPIDEFTRQLRITRANLPKESFEKVKTFIESGLQIYVDEIREDRLGGTIDISYSNVPMPESWELESVEGFNDWSFVVGKTRSRFVKSSLIKAPHLLIAGQTGGGKSTFLRQLISTLYVNNPRTHFILIDLKGGLEFQLFEKAKNRISVIGALDQAVQKLKYLDEVLDRRMALIKAHHCKDIDTFLKRSPSLLKNTDESLGINDSIDRHVIVIDEAAEIFLTGPLGSAKDTQSARRVLSKIARQGRSVGVHLVVATQRPDTKAIDSQVKANLTGILCFQMPNDASSITVLGNGRASDLPPTPGRAIWKSGSDQVEIQTPDLSLRTVEKIFDQDEKTASRTDENTRSKASDSHGDDARETDSSDEI